MSSSNSKWIIAVDPKSGKTFYYNTETKKTHWQKPTELASNEERTMVLNKNLLAAAQNRETENVKALIQQGANIDYQDKDGSTPLHMASENGHVDTVRLLLEKGATIDCQRNDGWTPLHTASTNGKVDTVRLLLKKGANIDCQGNDGRTPLHMASLWGLVNIVRLLLEKGANIDCRISDGQTPLHWASIHGHVDTVRLLLEKGATIECQNKNGNTPLHMVSYNGHVNIVRLLLEKGANIECKSNDGRTPLHLASQNGSADTVRLLLEKGAIIECQDVNGSTPLHSVGANGKVDIVRLLLEKGANIDCQRNDGFTPLHLASCYGHVDTVRLLLKKGANIESQRNDGRTALHSASLCGHVNIVRLLLEKGANIECQRNDGSTPLHEASNLGHVDIVRLLLEKGANIECQDVNGSMPLHSASTNGKVDIVRLLLEKGANIECQNKIGETPLHMASSNGKVDTVRLLLEKGTNIESQNNYGSTPLHMASSNGKVDTVRLLLEKGANIQCESNYGSTPLHLASMNGHADTVRFVLEKGANIDCKTKNGDTPLSLAKKLGKMEVVTLLISAQRQHSILPTAAPAAVTSGTFGGAGGVPAPGGFGAPPAPGGFSFGSPSPAPSFDFGCPSSSGLGGSPAGGGGGGLFGNPAPAPGGGGLFGSSSGGGLFGSSGGASSVGLFGPSPGFSGSLLGNPPSTGPTIVLNENLLQAAKNGATENVKALIEQGANIECQDKKGITPLHMASFNGNVDMVRLLLEKGANIECQDVGGFTPGSTPLHKSSENGHLDIVRLLLEKGANIECQDNYGVRPLHIASTNGKVDIVRLLLEKGSNIECQEAGRFTTGSMPLHKASENGHLDIVHLLLEKGADIECQNNYGVRPLHIASANGKVDIVRELLEKGANIECQDVGGFMPGSTPLHKASWMGHVDIVCLLLEKGANIECLNKSGDTPLSVAKKFGKMEVMTLLKSAQQPHLSLPTAAPVATMTQPAASPMVNNPHHNQSHPTVVTDNEQDEKAGLDERPEIEKSRTALARMENNPDDEPTILSLEYLNKCTDNFTSKVLGEGAFGKVYFGSDKQLQLQFAIKRAHFQVSDQDAINEVTLSFKKEISVLKRFRHPNIAVLYGYNILAQKNCLLLVYEYLSNRALSTFLMDEKGRTLLPGHIRLSIIYELARSVHFLNTGGCHGFKVFHRDIKSGNICLTNKFTAKLIDCGLAKFVRDEQGANIGSVTPTMIKSSGSSVFGTRGYICPAYALGKVTYSSACEVFSIGVVLTELITGCLQGGQSMRKVSESGEFSQKYILDDDDQKVENGWQVLMNDADPVVDWDTASLEHACKIAVKCMSAIKNRILLLELVDELGKNAASNFMTINSESGTELDTGVVVNQTHGKQEEEEFLPCILCHRKVMDTFKCMQNHPTCVGCLEHIVRQQIGQSGTGICCGIVGCQSASFKDEDLCGKISSSTLVLYVRERGRQKVLDECLKEMKADLSILRKQTSSMVASINEIKSGIQRALGALVYLAMEDVEKCPSLVWMVPAESNTGRTGQEWSNWAKNQGKRKYHLHLVCQHTFQAIEQKIEIHVTRDWVVQVAPVLKMCLTSLKLAASTSGLPFPIEGITVSEQLSITEEFVTSFLDDTSKKLLEDMESAIAEKNIDHSKCAELRPLVGAAYEAIAREGSIPKNSLWKEYMVPVINHAGNPMWIKKEYKYFYD